ncbi:MAG TPA: hypothetical protein VNO23_16850, partial [Candidatus Binatia bacterium]|nr:hypothetical protein [Candidatus Binatia bacterium]
MTVTAHPERPATLELAADSLTPVAAALRLGARCAFLLESVEEGARYGRYSFVGVRGRVLLVTGARARLIDAAGNVVDEREADDPLEALRRVLPPPRASIGADAFPTSAGVGYLAYEAAARWEPVPVPEADPLGFPDAVFHLPEAVIAFDHLAQVARLIGSGAETDLDRLRAVAGLLGRPVPEESPLAV